VFGTCFLKPLTKPFIESANVSGMCFLKLPTKPFIESANVFGMCFFNPQKAVILSGAPHRFIA
jgi:hypothetical protein